MNEQEGITSGTGMARIGLLQGQSRAILLEALLIHFSGGFLAVGMKLLYGLRCLSPCCQP